MTCHRRIDKRQAELAKIHIAAKQLGLDDDAYRAMLWTVARVRSAGDLDQAGRSTVLDHLKSRGFEARHRRKPRIADTDPQLRKIGALLADSGRPWSYGHAIAKRMFGKEDLTFCSAHEKAAVITALVKAAQKRKDNA